MGLFTYSVISLVFIMIMHFAVGIGDEFKLFVMVGIFILGAVMGAYSGSYEFGFTAAFVLSLILW